MAPPKMKVKICLVGEGAVGKTCLIRRFIQDQFDDRYISTLGAKVPKKESKVTEAEIRESAESYHASYMYTSAKTGQNVEEAFARLARMIAERTPQAAGNV